MSLYAQHGHAKSDRLDLALAEGTIDGVILGARNEPIDKIAACVNSFKGKGEVLFDPQFFISTFAPPNDRYLPDYPYYKGGLSSASFTGAKKLAAICEATIDFQLELGVDKLISPTIFCDGFETKWGQIALNLADTSLDYHAGIKDAPPLLVNFLIAEQALTSKKNVEAFLDQITSWEMSGIYLVIAREDGTYSQGFEPQRFAHALYMNYVLGEINGFEVVNGFSDFCGFILRAVGSSSFASGWYQGLRQFNKKSFIKSKGGGQVPRLRYSSAPLLNSIFLSELDDIRDAGLLENILSGVKFDNLLDSNSDAWNQRVSEHAHWETLSLLDAAIPKTLKARIDLVDSQLETANAIYFMLEEAGIVFSANSGPLHLESWTEAFKTFKSLIGKA